MVKITVLISLLAGFVPTAAAGQPPDSALWNADRTAAVTATPDESGTRVTAFLKQPDDSFLEIDLSGAESGNFSKLGRRQAEYDRFETKPIAWLPRQDGLLQVRIQTQAWRAGRRYTVSEPLIIRRDGTVLWR